MSRCRRLTTQIDMEVHLFQVAGRINGSVLFAVDRFEPEAIQSVVDVLEQPGTPAAALLLTKRANRATPQGSARD